MKILVTAGGTSEPIDSVRRITNSSTGQTGFELANFLKSQGFDVELCISKNSKFAGSKTINEFNFESFDDLDTQISSIIKENNYSVIIHAAAVSDYKVSRVLIGGQEHEPNSKVPSGKDKLILELSPTHKIINKIKHTGLSAPTLIAFKFTSTEKQEDRKRAAFKLLEESKADFVVLNDSSEKNESQHIHQIFSQNKELISEGTTKKQIYTSIADILKRYL